MFEARTFKIAAAGPKSVVMLEHRPDAAAKPVGPVHHIHILDRSGSMYASIGQLVDNVQSTFELIRAEDYMTIIWFASPGQFRTVVKGARKTDDIKTLLDSLRSVVGCTCFSDPIRETALVVDELRAICPSFSVTLFTDGCPVVPWSVAEEERRIFEVLNALGTKVMAFNTVGYGNYYNRDMLVRMSQTSQFGTLTHSSRIEQYYSIFNEGAERVAGMVREPAHVAALGAEVVYLGSTATKMTRDTMQLETLEQGKNRVFVVYDGAPGPIKVNGEKVDFKSARKYEGKSNKDDFLYAYANELYYAGRRREALEVVAGSLHDKYLADRQINAFTYDEVGVCAKALKDAVFDPKARWMDGLCSHDYVPKADALCVMDVLGVLFKGDNKYLPYSKNVTGYSRIGRKAEDQGNLFKMDAGEVLGPVHDFVFNKDHLNLSLRFLATGTVELDKKEAKRVGLDHTQHARIFRTHTLIKDGNLNLTEAEFEVDQPTYEKLAALKVPMLRLKHVETRVLIRLGSLPIVNRTYVDQSQDIGRVFSTTLEVTKLEAMQKVIGFYSDEYESRQNLTRGMTSDVFTPEQLEVLKAHGLSKDLTYHGVDSKVAAAGDSDSYEVRTMAFYLKGFSSWPKVAEVLAKVKAKGKLTPTAQMMAEAIAELQTQANARPVVLEGNDPSVPKFLAEKLREVKTELSGFRTSINTLKIAKIVTGDWFEGLTTDDKGNFLFESAGHTMIARADRTLQYIDAK